MSEYRIEKQRRELSLVLAHDGRDRGDRMLDESRIVEARTAAGLDDRGFDAAVPEMQERHAQEEPQWTEILPTREPGQERPGD